MRYGKYHFQSVLDRDALLPPFKGSTFRGVFGMALKKAVCTLTKSVCHQCILRERCVYSIVFETPKGESDSQDQGGRGKPSPPHPFVIEPPLSPETHLKKGTRFDFTLILFGEANEYFPYFVFAFEQMGRIGIGRRINGRPAGFHLETISSGEKTIYRGNERRLTAGTVEDLNIEDLDQNQSPVTEISIELQTPLRLKYHNRLHAELPFHVLIRAALRRIAMLNNYYGDKEPELDYRGLVNRATEVEMVDSQVKWYDWRRYSNRQERSMLMGGMVGRATYRGNLTEFIPLLHYGEMVHLGKATAFGLGKVKPIL